MPDGDLRGDRSGERVFTTLLWPSGPPVTWPYHLARLERDAQRMAMPAVAAGVIEAEVRAAIDALPGELHRVRIDLVAHGGSHLAGPPTETAVRVAVSAHLAPTTETNAAHLRLVTTSCGAGHPLGGIKRPDPTVWWARRAAIASGADDALLVCQSGHLIEAPTAALLIGLETGEVVAPGHACGAVDSTTLAWLASLRPLSRRTVAVSELPRVHWALLCNAVWGARPIATIERRVLAPPDRETQGLLWRAVRTCRDQAA